MNVKFGIFLLLLPLSFLEFGCATYGLMVPDPIGSQKTVFNDGNKSVISAKKNVVVVTPLDEKFSSGQRGDFLIEVKNGSKKDFIFSTENISVEAVDSESGEEMPLKVFSYDDLVNEEKDREGWASIAAALQGASDSIQAQNAGYSNTYGTYTYGAGGYGTYASTTYNYAEVEAAQRQASADSDARFERIKAEGEENMRNLSSTILKKNTIFPNTWYGGIVKIKLPNIMESSGKLIIIIVADKETHRFNFSYSRVE